MQSQISKLTQEENEKTGSHSANKTEDSEKAEAHSTNKINSNEKEIILVTLNSTYQHSSFGLRYLYANLDELQDSTKIIEFTIAKDPRDIVETLIKFNPQIIGFGVYIWNSKQILEVVKLLKKISPKIKIILGGPEVSHEIQNQEFLRWVDHVIQGEADFAFYDLCSKIILAKELQISSLQDEKSCQPQNIKTEISQVIQAKLPEIEKIKLPYKYYSDEDIANRVIYVEASRGCPYRCEYCLSSLDKSVRMFNLEQFLFELNELISRGARSFKFIDRTFNLSIKHCETILNFFLSKIELNLFLHFEMVPDRLPTELRELIQKFPHGSIQFEIGIQTLNPKVTQLISRRNDLKKVEENFKFLSTETGVHTHADLIVGLPGENIDSFAKGFDQLLMLGPDEIQVGILKRLKGTPIVRHDQEFEMVYSEDQPFQILRTRDVDFNEMQRMNRFSKFWDLYANSGNFKNFMKLFKQSCVRENISRFWQFMEFVKFLEVRHENHFGISLLNQVQSAWEYCKSVSLFNEEEVRSSLIKDYSIDGKRDIPRFFKTENDCIVGNEVSKFDEAKNDHGESGKGTSIRSSLSKRQRKHMGSQQT